MGLVCRFVTHPLLRVETLDVTRGKRGKREAGWLTTFSPACQASSLNLH